ncbi:MAG: acyl-CoA thioesterase [Pseudomonadota bacterium]
MSSEEKIEASETRITKAVFPNTTNHYATLFGGTALQWMDEAAFITATRFCRQKMVTVCSDRIDFKHPIPAGTFVELVGRVVKVGNTSLQVRVTVYLEQMYDEYDEYNESRKKAIEGLFTFVAIDDNMQPVAVRK